MTPDPSEDAPAEPIDPADFEAIVAAALKVDPKGITGQKAEGKRDEEGPAD